MLYDAYQAQSDFLAPAEVFAGLCRDALSDTNFGPAANSFFKSIAAGAEVFSRSRLSHKRPAYAIQSAMVAGRCVAVQEEVALDAPFGALLHFRKETKRRQPPVLLVAPMAGHFATLLRHTIRTMLDDHDVYLTDWKNARDVQLSAGRFGLDDYIDQVIAFLAHIGPGVHAVGVCQPCPALLAAASVMAERKDAALPCSISLIAGPIDTRIHPTDVNRLANLHALDWFEHKLTTRVPQRYAGAGRLVYPGFLQIGAFLGMNVPRHARAQAELYGHVLKGDKTKTQANKKFYDEYLSVADLPAEFYLETVQKIFQEHHLPRGRFAYRGARIDPAAIRKSALLTIEGEKDDICGLGQTRAAHELTPGIKASRKRHYTQSGAGHYGAFSGSKWQARIYPILRQHILAATRE